MTCDFIDKKGNRCGEYEIVVEKYIHAEDVDLDSETETTGLFPHPVEYCYDHRNTKPTFKMIKDNFIILTGKNFDE